MHHTVQRTINKKNIEGKRHQRETVLMPDIFARWFLIFSRNDLAYIVSGGVLNCTHLLTMHF